MWPSSSAHAGHITQESIPSPHEHTRAAREVKHGSGMAEPGLCSARFPPGLGLHQGGRPQAAAQAPWPSFALDHKDRSMYCPPCTYQLLSLFTRCLCFKQFSEETFQKSDFLEALLARYCGVRQNTFQSRPVNQ